MSDPVGIISGINAPSGAQPNHLATPRAPQGPGQAGGPSFKDVLMQNLDKVNQLQEDAERAIEDLHAGKRDDVDGVLIAKQKADLAFQLLQQVRNKLVDAYEEIRQMRV